MAEEYVITNFKVDYEINILPKLKNNENSNVEDNVDTLNGDDVGESSSIEKNDVEESSSIEKNDVGESSSIEKNDVGESSAIEKKQTTGIPKSIKYDSALTESYCEMLPANCDTDCQRLCYYSILHPQRKDIYKEFSMLNNVTEQNYTITQLVKLRKVQQVDGTFEYIPIYHLKTNNLTVNVCKKFFINTLGITKHRLNSVLKPINYSWYSDKDTALKAQE